MLKPFIARLLDREERSEQECEEAMGLIMSGQATEAQIADSALANRIKYLRTRFLKATERSLAKVAWYLFHTEGIIIPVNRVPLTVKYLV